MSTSQLNAILLKKEVIIQESDCRTQAFSWLDMYVCKCVKWEILQKKTFFNPTNKKVLLRERKRHTARHVASTPYVVLSWLTPPPPPRLDLTPPPSPLAGPDPPPRRLDLTPPPRLSWPTDPTPPPPPWTDRFVDGQTRVKTLPSLVLRTRAVKIEVIFKTQCIVVE